MNIELCGDCLDPLVRASLTQCLGYLKADLAKAESGHDYFHTFEADTAEDIKQLRKHIKAFDRVLSYYGGPLGE